MKNDPEHIAKLEGISKKAQHIYDLKKKSLALHAELARTTQYNLELAKTGIDPKDVSHCINGNQVGATHNYKITRKIKLCAEGPDRLSTGYRAKYSACTNAQISRALPVDATVCPECHGEVVTSSVRMSPSYLRDKLPRHIVGVELNDGSFKFFENPIPPINQ
jgi:hypothetical protein